MSADFGFKPVTEENSYFISYRNEAKERVGRIACRLNDMGVPMWYDYGIRMDEKDWEKVVSEKINDCKAMIFFATKDTFADDDKENYQKIEYDAALSIGKTIYVVWMDAVTAGDTHKSLLTWYTRIGKRQRLDVAGESWDDAAAAWQMVERFGLDFRSDKLISSAFGCLKKGNYDQADVYFRAVIDREPSSAEAYLGRLMADLGVPDRRSLAGSAKPLDYNEYYQKAVLHGDDSLRTELSDYNEQIKKRVEENRLKGMYDDAVKLKRNARSEAEYDEAAEAFAPVKGFKDADRLAAECRLFADVARKAVAAYIESHGSEMKPADGYGDALKGLYVGGNIEFGRYPYGKNRDIRPLLWRVLDIKDGKALIITEKLIDCMPYNKERGSITWEDSDVRRWLNQTFIYDAFDDNERKRIVEVTNNNPDNERNGSKGGNDTRDKVFLLSISEAMNADYFMSKYDRMAAVTPYARRRGGSTGGEKLDTGEETGWWWLRSPGLSSDYAASVYIDGDVYDGGNYVYDSAVSVRPALWLNL